jgi:tripartite-type tricarboxylate transporter receptor subunit TctC
MLVEQNVGQSLEIADRAYVLENGSVRFSGKPDALLGSDELRRAYLGLRASRPVRALRKIPGDLPMKRRHPHRAPALAALAFAAGARAQIGNAPVRILVGAPAGGSTDTLARSLAVSMGPALGRTVIVENKPGAGGNIAADAVAKAAPDGNTLLLSFTSHAINATLYPTLPFDPVKDFTALTCVATSPSILVAIPSAAGEGRARAHRAGQGQAGQLNFAIGAVGSSLHMAGEAFKMQSGVDIVNIPTRAPRPPCRTCSRARCS